jgi:hypothetical protein
MDRRCRLFEGGTFFLSGPFSPPVRYNGQSTTTSPETLHKQSKGMNKIRMTINNNRFSPLQQSEKSPSTVVAPFLPGTEIKQNHMQAKNYRTLSEATRDLREEGYTASFELEKDQLRDINSGKKYGPEDLRIVEMYRFEGASNPSDMSIVFAVEAKNGQKGVVTSSYGTYANHDLLKFMDKIEKVY